MFPDDPVRYPETQTHADSRLFRSKERLKRPGELLFVHTRAVILKPYVDTILIMPAADGRNTVSVAPAADRIERI